MIRAVFFDVDGTLVSYETHGVLDSAREAIGKLRERGIKCVVATGRQLNQFRKMPAGDIPFDAYVTLNGQVCVDDRDRIFHHVPIQGEMKERLLKIFRDREMPLLISGSDGSYVNFINDRVHYVHDFIGTPLPEVSEYKGREIYQCSAYARGEEQDWIRRELPDCVVTSWSIEGVDIIASGGGKVAGIAKYLELTGIAREETMAFGDGENDMQMLRYVGCGIAMGNAADSVKAAADYVTDHIDRDGLAKALEHFNLI